MFKTTLLHYTRWVDQHDYMLVFLGLFDAIIDSLTICSWLNHKNIDLYIMRINSFYTEISFHYSKPAKILVGIISIK